VLVPPSWALKWSCLPLSPVVSLHVGVGGVFLLVAVQCSEESKIYLC